MLVKHFKRWKCKCEYCNWTGTLEHQIHLLKAGYLYGYPECCIFEFVQEFVASKEIAEMQYARGSRVRYTARYENSPPNQFWVPCWNCIP